MDARNSGRVLGPRNPRQRGTFTRINKRRVRDFNKNETILDFHSHLFSRAIFKLWGKYVQTLPKTQSLQVPFSLPFKNSSELPETGEFGQGNCLGGVGWHERKQEKRMHKKRWALGS